MTVVWGPMEWWDSKMTDEMIGRNTRCVCGIEKVNG